MSLYKGKELSEAADCALRNKAKFDLLIIRYIASQEYEVIRIEDRYKERLPHREIWVSMGRGEVNYPNI